MKSIVNQKEEVKEKGFPKLMISHNGQIVLFDSPTKGTVMHKGGSALTVGSIQKNYNMIQFKDFNGTVTLSND